MNDDTHEPLQQQTTNDHHQTTTITTTQEAANHSFENSSSLLVPTTNDNILDSNQQQQQHFNHSDITKSDFLGLFDDEDDEEDDDYQDLNEDDDIELENFDWIDWDDILPDDDLDANSSQAKRGRKKYQKFEKPSILPSIRPKSPTRQQASSNNSVNTLLNNQQQLVQIPPPSQQPYPFPFPQMIHNPQLFPPSASAGALPKNFNQFPIVPPPLFPTYHDMIFPPTTARGVSLTNPSQLTVSNSTTGLIPSSSSSPSSPSSSSTIGANSISKLFSSSQQTTISDDQMKELYSQIQIHTQLLFYNYFLSSFNQELKELNKKFKNLITSYLNSRKESVNNKLRKLLYLFNVSKDVRIVNLLDGTRKALTESSFSSSSTTTSSASAGNGISNTSGNGNIGSSSTTTSTTLSTIENADEKSVDEWIQLLNSSILDVEGIESMDIFLDFDYSFFHSNNQINWELFVKFLKPFKLFSNQSLLAEIQESIYYFNTVAAERGVGSKRIVFTIPEDNLLLIGLKKHWKPGTTIKWEKIRDEFVPNKSAKQLRVRYKNMVGKRAASLEFNPFKTFRSIAEETNQQYESSSASGSAGGSGGGSGGNNASKKKDDQQQDYSHLFESIKIFKITSKLTRKELPIGYKDLSKIHTYVPRDNNISDSESDDQYSAGGEKKRKKSDKINPKKKKKQDTEDLTSLEASDLLTSEKIDQNPTRIEQNPIIANPIFEQPINPLNESSLSEVFLKPDLDLQTSKILPFDDVGSIDSSSDEEEDHVEKDSEVIFDGLVHKFTYEDDKYILVSLQNCGLKIGSSINGEEFDNVLNDIGKELGRPKEVIRARYNKIISVNKK